MSKNLIYANADEFHVKSTIVYAKEMNKLLCLYWDSECTKPIYSDELERLYLAGGLKVDFGNEGGNGMADVIAKPVGKSSTPEMVTVMSPQSGDNPSAFFINCYATFRNASSEESEGGLHDAV